MKTVLSICVMTLLAAGVFAQKSATSNPSAEGELRTVEGCLSKVGKTFVISGGGPGPKQYRIIGGDTSNLEGKLGDTVKIVGLVGESGPLESVAPPYNEGSTTGVGYSTIVAQKAEKIYSNCSEPGKAWPGDHK